ncbi:NrfD/PsrC family molybdoenzyme membrane anchor subunit [Shumkonia mesophila]|uniref:NrfD/PsrC family molybdoenzyme membrane anchor subunit n=1 Tax=Shumkonia mesophila TaxID=2838854 RepID=UPI0029346FFD|nr:NrfD/PsrC family molybdoenzyme membrane anchor subunit [Shumkonia mesophila]
MSKVEFREIEGRSGEYYTLLGGLAVLAVLGLGAAAYTDHVGHVVTGMSNQIPWAVPHVFAIFLIVAASGALNVASIGTVFGKLLYKPLARLSGLLAFALMAGGLSILVLDLGRPDRLVISMTHFNFKSIFVWNINFYMGFFAIVAAYLWTAMDWRLAGVSKSVGILAFLWRLALTSCTGWVFGFIVARQGWDAAVMAPMFIVYSFAYGLAIFLLVLMAAYGWTQRPLGDAIIRRLKNLLGVFVAGSLYFTVVQQLTNMYATEHHGIVRFILLDGGIFTVLFWVGQVLIGGVLPMILVWYPKTANSRQAAGLASLLVILGGLAQMFVTIIGGLAYPQILFPGMEVSSSFFDGIVNGYAPSAPEVILGIGGIAIALLMVTIAVKFLRFLPESLGDAVADPHHRPAEASAKVAGAAEAA